MNTGIQDAVNLGWKLAYYMRGLAGRRLLNSYAEERLLAVERVEHCTSEHTRAIFGLEKHGPVHDLYRPGFANRRSLRDIVAQQFSGLAFDHSVYGSMVGRHVPFFPVNSPTMEVANSYDLPRTGRHAILVPEGTDVSKLAKMRARWGHVSQSYTLDSDGYQVVTAARPGEVCLVRPDGFIGFSGNLEECERYLERVHSILDGEGGRSALGIHHPLRPAMTTESHARPADIRDAVRMPTVRREIQALHSPSVQPPITPPDDRSHAMALASRQNCKPTSD
ncbi:hypothetical protein THIARS_60199 [Thiomonas delicata]|uniref:FAD-binding domain-containing protein n=1 Tax=Thiomonas delicata TaxID=364030 RepID=A0A238D2J4_THIDL|nr:hypothetical protein THIARS_60199 [Thiomonas delicata]